MTLSNLTITQLAERVNLAVDRKKHSIKLAMEHLEARRVHAAKEHLDHACIKDEEIRMMEIELIARAAN